MTRLLNRTVWTPEKGGVVSRAVFDAARIQLDLELGTRRYAVVLTPAAEGPSAWKGIWSRAGATDSGAVSARVYRAATGAMAVIGEWNEDNTVYRWFAEFDLK